MFFNVMVYEEGNPSPIENYKLLVKENSPSIIINCLEKIFILIEPLTNSCKVNQDSVRLYLALTLSLLLFSIFHPQAKATTILFLLLSFILASESYLRPYSQENRNAFFMFSYFFLALGNYISPIFPNSASYIFPMVSVYKSQRKSGQDINLAHWAIMLIPELLQGQSVESLLFSAFTLYFYLSWHSNTPQPRLSKNTPVIESPSKHLIIENPPTPYANILQSINHSINLLQSSHTKESILESTECLQKVLKIMQKNQNIYSPTFKQITKNMDIEDKIFILENTFASNIEVSSFSPVQLTPLDLKYGVDELTGILKQIGKEWNFNTIFVASCTANQALYTCGEYVFGYYDFIKTFKINRDTLKNFLRILESKYIMNPYHNSCHAADVMNSFLYLCSSVVSLIPSVELFACTLACLGHDIAHPGTNNRFMVQTKHELALQYNDISVLENMHARELFTILNQVACNIISKVGDYWVVRKVIVELILSTDMAKHFDFVAACKACEKPIKQKIENFTDRLELYKLCIKASDISHTAKTTELHEKWCKLLMEEFFSQGDKEKELNLPVSMYCDRKTTDVQKSQAGFLKNIALPLFATLHQYIQWDNIELICLQQLRRNIQYWEKRKDNGRNSTKDMTLFEYFRPEIRRVTVPKRLI